jgi:hypothetical protein
VTEAELKEMMVRAWRELPTPPTFIPVGPRAWRIFKQAVEFDRLRRCHEVKHARKPSGLDMSDWRMALRRNLNGDTR